MREQYCITYHLQRMWKKKPIQIDTQYDSYVDLTLNQQIFCMSIYDKANISGDFSTGSSVAQLVKRVRNDYRIKVQLLTETIS